MKKTARHARAIAIAKTKHDQKLLVVRSVMLAAGATSALLAVLLTRFL